MNQEDTFRAVLLVGFLVILPIALYHRIKSQATGERLDRRREGLFLLATLRPVGMILWLGLIAYMVDPSSPPRVAAVDGSRCVRGCSGIALLDFQQPWEEPDGYRGHQERANAGHHWSVSPGPPPVL